MYHNELDPYYTSYVCLPIQQIERMLSGQAVIRMAVENEIHKSTEADLRISALKSALEKAREREWVSRERKMNRRDLRLEVYR